MQKIFEVLKDSMQKSDLFCLSVNRRLQDKTDEVVLIVFLSAIKKVTNAKALYKTQISFKEKIFP